MKSTLSTTRKPMAAAIRTFVTGMQFPPAPKHGPNPNTDLATFTITMLQFALGITEGCTDASVSPAVSQVAEVIHGSDRTVKRRLKALRELGLLTVRERGHFSTEYTFHQTPVAGTTVDLAAAGTTVGTAKKPQRGQLPLSAGTTSGPAGTTRVPAGTTVVPLWGKASGSSLEKPSLEKEAVERSGSFSLPDQNDGALAKGQVPPEGWVEEIIESGATIGWVMFDDTKVMLATYGTDLAACHTAWRAQGVEV
jgi:hypothetical protein